MRINFVSILSLALWVISVIAISDVREFSLRNLVTIDSIDDIKSDWMILGASEYNEGRLILTPKPSHISNNEESVQFGSIWSNFKPSNNLNSFTTELTLRSLGNFGHTGAGFSLFLVDFSSINLNDVDNFGGPKVFNGLQITLNMDNQLGPVIKAYLNDGRELNMGTDYLGAYKYEYQSSNVPITIKLAYSNRFFKVTCDNKLLFQTDQINLSQLLSKDVRLGLTGKSKKDYEYHEQFEILRLSTYDSVTTDMNEDNDEVLVAKHQEALAQKKPNVEKFLQQQERLRSQLKNSVNVNNNEANELQKDFNAVKETLSSLIKLTQNNDQTVLQQQIFGLSKSIDRLGSNFQNLHEQFITLNAQYGELSDMFKRQFSLLDNYDSTLRAFDKVLQNQLKTSDNLDSKLSTISTYYSNSINKDMDKNNNDDSYSKIKSLLCMIFFPLLAMLILVVLWIHRLRNDIKHAKVL